MILRIALPGLCVAAAVARAAPGDLDVTFAGTGVSRIGFGGATDTGQAIALQADGKLVVAGHSQRVEGANSVFIFSVVRYLPDGSLDPSFGGDGRVSTELGLGAIALSVKVQDDGKIVVAGQRLITGTTSEMAVVRYLSDGSLDPSFGGDGIVTTMPSASGLTRGETVLIQPDGKIVVTGSGFAVRYLTDGTPDPAFGGGDGIAPAGASVGRGAALQADGKLLLTGGSCSGGIFPTCSVAVARLNTDGSPDNTFDGDGIVVTPLPSLSELGHAVAIQRGDNTLLHPDKIVVAGDSLIDTAIIRYNLNGSLDTTFDTDGILVVSLGAGNDEANAIGFQTTPLIGATRIIIAGFAETASGRDFMVARLLLNGGFDNTFDGDGIALTPVTVGDDRGQGMVIANDRITVAGSANGDFGVVRYNVVDGSLDPAFDGDGKRVDDVGDLLATARGVALQPDGKIIVAGDRAGFDNTFALLRYNADGSLDPAFDGDGKVTLPLGATGRAVTLQSGLILVAGSVGTGSGTDFALARYLADGSLDPAFNGDGNSDGIIVTPIGAGEDVAYAAAVQPDGKIVLAGRAHNGLNFDFAAARYLPNGAPDTTFDGDGKAITPIGAGDEEGRAVALQADGKLIVAGFSSNGANTDFAVVRYKTDGTPDFSFSFDGKVTTPILAGNDAAHAVSMDGDKIVVAGFAHNGANNDFAVARYTADGSPDALFDVDGKLTTEIGAEDTGGAVRTEANGRILVAGFSFTGTSTDFALVRYNPNGSLDGSYGTGGRVVVNFGGDSADLGFALALDSIGRAVVAGASDGVFGTARLLGDPVLTIRSRPTGNPVAFEGIGVPGMTNSLRFSSDLSGGSFGVLATIIPNADGFWEFVDTDAIGRNRRFYQLTFP